MGEEEAEIRPERHNKGPAQQDRRGTEPRRCYYVCAAIPLVLAITFYFMPFIIDEWEARYGYGVMPSFDLPPGVMDQFRVYDANGDGCIDPSEFVVLGIRIREEVCVLSAELQSKANTATPSQARAFLSIAPPTQILMHLSLSLSVPLPLRMIASSLRT